MHAVGGSSNKGELQHVQESANYFINDSGKTSLFTLKYYILGYVNGKMEMAQVIRLDLGMGRFRSAWKLMDGKQV